MQHALRADGAAAADPGRRCTNHPICCAIDTLQCTFHDFFAIADLLWYTYCQEMLGVACSWAPLTDRCLQFSNPFIPAMNLSRVSGDMSHNHARCGSISYRLTVHFVRSRFSNTLAATNPSTQLQRSFFGFSSLSALRTEYYHSLGIGVYCLASFNSITARH